MKRVLNLQVGGELCHVFFMERERRLLNAVKRNWCEYITDSTEGGCRVEIVPYVQGRSFSWDPPDLERFKAYFLSVHRRFPSDDQIGQTIGESVRLLQHLDPKEESMRHIRCCMDEPDTLIYVRVGLDLVFFDTESNIAFFFLQRTSGLFRVLMWMMHGLRIKPPALMQGFINGMMFVLSHLLIHDKGLLLHASAIQKDNRAALFLGLSGAGKSTVTRLCRPDVCFSDDGSIIKKEGDRVFAYHSPFGQIRKRRKTKGPEKGEIEKIFLLAKGRNHIVLPIRRNELMNTILRHLIHFYKYLGDETACAGFYLVKDVLDILPAHRLEFAKKGGLWDNISYTKSRGRQHVGERQEEQEIRTSLGQRDRRCF